MEDATVAYAYFASLHWSLAQVADLLLFQKICCLAEPRGMYVMVCHLSWLVYVRPKYVGPVRLMYASVRHLCLVRYVPVRLVRLYH